MASVFSRITGRKDSNFPPPEPEEKIQVVGDIHGRFDLLESLSNKLDPLAPIILVGDYIDRGDNSADVLRGCMQVSRETNFRLTCLTGNHESMLLKFIEDPRSVASMWLNNGGQQTLASFGVRLVSDRVEDAVLDDARDQLVDAMGGALISWLEDLPISFRSGNVAVVHAGADPALPLEDQSRRCMIWGHPDFDRVDRSDGNWIAHGHTIVDQPGFARGRISVDTGAYATGRLTAAVIEDGEVEFITT
ncbi:metallophosphoesterase [Pelagovum pacificum]|uniref:Serine/threonine protein phosphatase n=1 Tax=Pelagovum pacificum TaxID=2588711 RepID=A0A5C5GH72_9RHOB|nr:metallophosphoesterase [Pelagovum pacificum]QQA42734.1 serine/threonine protein phosphatase [Pelagovum pacificum]TNY34115.1 serine/threonine protein phosphatase [Pelagovum pacificum]